MRLERTRYLLPAAIAAALVLAACGSDQGSTGEGSSAAEPSAATTFVLDEWSITAPADALRAGTVNVTATNEGSETHELVIVNARDIGSLPTKSDGSVDEAKIPDSRKAGEIADLAAGKTATKQLDLPAGDYVAFCNIVEDMGSGDMGSGGMGSGGMGHDSTAGNSMEHVHFRLGMVTPFTVT